MEQELRFDASSGLGDRRLTLLLFRNVGNAAAILDAVLGRAEAAAVPEQPMAVINANLIVDPFQVHLAANKALIHEQAGTLATKSLSSELLFHLSTSAKIGTALKTFGVNGSTKNMLVAIFDATPEDLRRAQALVQGTPAPLEQLSEVADVAAIRKEYKIPAQEAEAGPLVDSVVSRIALKI